MAKPAAKKATKKPAKTGIDTRIARLEKLLSQIDAKAQSSKDRAEVENVFAQYMYLHNAFRDSEIIDLWAAKGTPGIRAQYSNNGVYTNWDSITYYHRDRPAPKGKLILHFLTTPMIEVAGDGKTAKGLWIAAGIESGLTDPEVAKQAPDFMYGPELVEGKRVWQHTVYLKYGIDFLKQDGRWKIWHFHCFECARSPFHLGWIPFASKAQNDPFNYDLMYFGEDGRPVFMPKPDGPATIFMNPYRTDTSQVLDAKPPVPYKTFSETFEY
ncbi:MAG TPA: nuclear transport factor 2 family protein [Terriglobales bacterium]|nr:nuclear transport factor 2 family protein [Terriglobales bacterium]